MTVKPMLISKQLVDENLAPDGTWALRCACGERLAFAARDRGTDRYVLTVTHGPDTLVLRGGCTETLLWAIGLADPVGVWIDGLHAAEDDEVGP